MSEAVTGIESVYDKAAGLEQLCDLSASMNIFMNISMNKSLQSNQSFNSSSSNKQTDRPGQICFAELRSGQVDTKCFDLLQKSA